MGPGFEDGGVGHLSATTAAVAVCLGLVPVALCLCGAVLASAAVAPCTAVEEPLPTALVAGVLAIVITTIVATASAPCCEGTAGEEGESDERKLHGGYELKRMILLLLQRKGTVVYVGIDVVATEQGECG